MFSRNEYSKAGIKSFNEDLEMRTLSNAVKCCHDNEMKAETIRGHQQVGWVSSSKASN